MFFSFLTVADWSPQVIKKSREPADSYSSSCNDTFIKIYFHPNETIVKYSKNRHLTLCWLKFNSTTRIVLPTASSSSNLKLTINRNCASMLISIVLVSLSVFTDVTCMSYKWKSYWRIWLTLIKNKTNKMLLMSDQWWWRHIGNNKMQQQRHFCSNFFMKIIISHLVAIMRCWSLHFW